MFFVFKDEVCGVDPTVFRRFYHEEVEEFDEDVAEPQYIDKRCDVSRLPIFQSIRFIQFRVILYPFSGDLFGHCKTSTSYISNFRRPITRCLGGGQLAGRSGERTRRARRRRRRQTPRPRPSKTRATGRKRGEIPCKRQINKPHI